MKTPHPTNRLKPLSVNGLLCLMGRPNDFFSGAFNLTHIPSLLTIGFICGLERASVSLPFTTVEPDQIANLFNGIAPQWSQVWRSLLPVAVVMGILKWFVGGFWYSLRAKWCGYDGRDALLPKSIFMYSEAILAIPLVLHLIFQTLIYADPTAANLATNPTMVHLVAMSLGAVSILISYNAAKRLLGISGPMTRLWFLSLPLALLVFTLMTLVFVK